MASCRSVLGARAVNMIFRTLALSFAIAIASLPGDAAAGTTCDRVAATTGSDLAPGTLAQPFRTAVRLTASLQEGQTGCLRGGRYAESLNVTRAGSATAPVRLQSYPGERAELVGRLAVSAPHVQITGLSLVGLNPTRSPSPLVAAADVLIEGNDITNNHTADCLTVGSATRAVTGVTVRANRIHDCGVLPSLNRHNGVNVTHASDTRIVANWIYDNADRGVQLFPGADGSRVASNVIDGNGEGVMIAGDATTTSDGNTIENNLITNSLIRDNVEASWMSESLVGRDNVVRSNCVHGGARDDGDGGIADLRLGFVADRNLIEDPLYANRAAKDFRLSPASPCRVLFGDPEPVGCSKVAATTGSDGATGTAARPYRTVERLADSLQPGQTGCLRAGTFEGNVRLDRGGRAGAPVTLTSFPGERATIVGRIVVTSDADFVTLSRLYLNGTNAENLPSPTVNADDVSFTHNDVTNDHTAICFILGSNEFGRARRTLIQFNRIHDCGKLPANNHEHGIYVEAADEPAIVDNWIYKNADRGVQLYPDSQGGYIARNVLDWNGQGVILSRESSGNVIEHNLISNSRLRWNVEQWELTGILNVVRRNCVWTERDDLYGRSGGIQPADEFLALNNTVADPQYVDRAGADYRVRLGSRCLGAYSSSFVTPGP